MTKDNQECDDIFVKNYYQGIYVTETILGNPNGDFVDNSPRNFDGKVFTTDKCIKYNIRKYLHDNFEDIKDLNDPKNIVFFFPRPIDNPNDMKFKTRTDAFEFLLKNFSDIDGNDLRFEELLNRSPDVRMFGGTFTFQGINSHQIYGPIQLSYGLDLNNAQIMMHQIGSPFADNKGTQKTVGSQAIVDDAIISYDISINPNNCKNLLLEKDLCLFKESLWFGTNLRKTTSKTTDSKLIILIKFINKNSEGKCTAFNIGELNKLISIDNKKNRQMDEKIILDCKKLKNRLDEYNDYIDSIEMIYNTSEIQLKNFYDTDDNKYYHYSPKKLLGN